MVEYALVLGLLLVGLIGVAGRLETGSGDEVGNSANCVSTRPPPASCQIPTAATTTSTTTGSGTDPGGGTPPPPADATFAGATASVTATSWGVDAVVDIKDDAALPIPDADVRLSFRVTTASGSQTFYGTCRTLASGQCTVRFDSPDPAAPEIVVGFDDVLFVGEQTVGPFPTPVTVLHP